MIYCDLLLLLPIYLTLLLKFPLELGTVRVGGLLMILLCLTAHDGMVLFVLPCLAGGVVEPIYLGLELGNNLGVATQCGLVGSLLPLLSGVQ